MPIFSSKQKILSARGRFSDIEMLEFGHLSLSEAHRALGNAVKDQVYKIIKNKFNELGAEKIEKDLATANDILSSLEQKINDRSIDEIVRHSLHEYLICLHAWADGLQLNAYINHLLELESYQQFELTPIQLALFLQNDMTGCQTGMYRHEDGTISLWHTEEDFEPAPGSRFDKLRIMKFRNNENEFYSFIYPDLLPGPAFNWRSDFYVQAVDALFFKEIPVSNGILANIACWVKLLLGNSISLQDVISQLSPFIDGYSINVICLDGEKILGSKIEFIADTYLTAELKAEPGSFVFQVNILTDGNSKLSEMHEDKALSSRHLYKQRIYRTKKILKRYLPTNSLGYFRRLMSSRIGGEFAYANEDVKSYFIAHLGKYDLNIEIGIGPAMRNECSPIQIYYSE